MWIYLNVRFVERKDDVVYVFHHVIPYGKCNHKTLRAYVGRIFFFFYNHTATPEIYTRPYTLSLHDALPISITARQLQALVRQRHCVTELLFHDGKRRSEEHTSELQSHGLISFAVFCLK